MLGLGLIGGSVLRAAVAAGREALGYNRSADGVAAARSDGFTATADLTEALAWASARQALIVVAVPMPAVGWLLDHIKQIAPDCPITDVISVKNPVLQQVRSADSSSATSAAIRWPAPPIPAGWPETPGSSSGALGDHRRRACRRTGVGDGDELGPRLRRCCRPG